MFPVAIWTQTAAPKPTHGGLLPAFRAGIFSFWVIFEFWEEAVAIRLGERVGVITAEYLVEVTQNDNIGVGEREFIGKSKEMEREIKKELLFSKGSQREGDPRCVCQEFRSGYTYLRGTVISIFVAPTNCSQPFKSVLDSTDFNNNSFLKKFQ